MAGISRGGVLVVDQKLIDGVQQHLTQFASLSVDGQLVTSADIVKVLQGRIDVGKAVVTANAARTGAIQADRDECARTATFVSSLRRIILGMFTHAPETLAAFGLTPPKGIKRTVATAAAAVAKNKATRKARGTLGPKEKLKIHGIVPEISADPKG